MFLYIFYASFINPFSLRYFLARLGLYIKKPRIFRVLSSAFIVASSFLSRPFFHLSLAALLHWFSVCLSASLFYLYRCFMDSLSDEINMILLLLVVFSLLLLKSFKK